MNVELYFEVMGMSRKRPAIKKRKKSTKRPSHEVAAIIVIAIGLFIFVSIYTGASGYIGVLVKNALAGVFGFVSYAVPIFIIAMGVTKLVYNKNMASKRYGILAVCVMLVIMTIAHLIIINTRTLMDMGFGDFLATSYALGNVYEGGGIVGGIVSFALVKLFGYYGAFIIIICALLVALLTLTRFSLKRMVERTNHLIIKSKRDKQTKEEVDTADDKELLDQLMDSLDKLDSDIEDIKIDSYIKPVDNNHLKKEGAGQDNGKDSQGWAAGTRGEILEISQQGDNVNYSPPPISLLNDNTTPLVHTDKKDIINNAKILEDTLSSFGVSAKVIQISRGPAITRYELQPASGVKVSKIVNLADDIALNLAASGVRIEAPIPGKAAVGVEVPNKDISPVMLKEVMQSKEYKNSPSKLAFALGKDITGNNVVGDLGKMPHLLIAGSTGSGKSVCINSIIISLLFNASPEDVKMIMIDPKVVELSSYNGIPHLLIPVITDVKKAAGALNWVVQEMIDRYGLFAEKKTKDIHRYNRLLAEHGGKKLPQIVVIIDELADLMMAAPGDVEDAICRIAQMARAAGIHLVIATQRPSVDVITGVIKANIPSRIAFAVSSQADSRTILDIGGAEKLLGKGDMLYYPVGASKPVRIQGCYVSEQEVERVVGYIKEQRTAHYEENLLDEIAVDSETHKRDDDDELLPTAVELVIDSGQASISMLQRRLRIGYARAARIIDEMERRGIIGGYGGSKPRQVLIKKEDMHKYI
ncbi:MAG TPA: DNA translocase FtsK [Clostridiales bacterium]|nr:DNA translocase FtsK [Clostridiales bacterium]